MVGLETLGSSFEADGEGIIGVYVLTLPFLFRDMMIRMQSRMPRLYGEI